MIKVNIIDGVEVRTVPFIETDPWIEITEEELRGLEEGRLKCKNGQLVNCEEETLLLAEIDELKRLLEETDYQAIKFAEGELTEEQYTPIREQRRAWRAQINQKEGAIE